MNRILSLAACVGILAIIGCGVVEKDPTTAKFTITNNSNFKIGVVRVYSPDVVPYDTAVSVYFTDTIAIGSGRTYSDISPANYFVRISSVDRLHDWGNSSATAFAAGTEYIWELRPTTEAEGKYNQTTASF